MGVATAKIVGRDHTLVLGDVRNDRLDDAAGTLEALGISATLVNCDVTDRGAVEQLFRTAADLGDDRVGHPHRRGEPQHGRCRVRHDH